VRIVVLGTGTDVGKTFVTAALARGLSRSGAVLALKPIESGVCEGAAGDAGTIAKAAGHEPRLSRWRYGKPVSPHLASRLVGEAIEISDVVAWVQHEEAHASPAPHFTLVELAGGAFSPLAPGSTNVDLALALDPAAWLLVAPDALGVLHDVSAVLRALPRRPDAVLLSQSRPPDASTGTNAPELERLGICSVLEVVRAGVPECTAAVDWLERRRISRTEDSGQMA
jgi:dethiobiotin synthetase